MLKHSKSVEVDITSTEGLAQSYRLKGIIEIGEEIDSERNKNAILYIKYRKSVRIVKIIDYILATIAMKLGAAGLCFLSTIIAVPTSASLGGIAIAAGTISTVAKQISKKLELKADKHEKIKILAETKLNTFRDYISKALEDEMISPEEFSIILCELEKNTIL